MNPIELLMPDGKPSAIYACEKCKQVYGVLGYATRCCDWRCKTCGVECSRGLNLCQDCYRIEQDKKHAERIEKADTIEEYNSWVYCEEIVGYKDGWFESLQELIEYTQDLDEDERPTLPKFAFCSIEDIRQIDLNDALDRICEDGYEGMNEQLFTLADETQAAIDRFNEANRSRLTVFQVDYTRKVRIPWPLDIETKSTCRD